MYRIFGRIDGRQYIGGLKNTYEEAETEISFLRQYYIENTFIMFNFWVCQELNEEGEAK